MSCCNPPGTCDKIPGTVKPVREQETLMSKVLEWAIAILGAIFLAYVLVDKLGLPVWLSGVIGVVLVAVGVILGNKERKL